MFAMFGFSLGEIILLLVVGLMVLGVVTAVGLVLYFVLRKKKPEPSAQTPPPVPPKV